MEAALKEESRTNGTALQKVLKQSEDSILNNSNSLVGDLISEIKKTDGQPPLIVELRNKYRIDLSIEVPAAPIALEIIGRKYNAPIAMYGGLTLVTAKAKSGKTYAHSILVSALIKGGDLYGKIRPHFIVGSPNKRKVIVFDTEQSSYHVQKVGRRIQYLAGTDNCQNLEVWKLRTEPNNIKKQIIQQVIYSDPDICAIVIDGGRDTIFDINSSEEAGIATTELLKWAEELGIAIIVILHQNKGDNNARGHYGTEAKNKSEIIVNVNKDKESGIYTIEAEDCRDREFDPIAFQIDDSGMPVIIEDFVSCKTDKEGNKKSLLAHQVPDSQHFQILKEIFLSSKRPKYSELQKLVKLSFEKMGASIGDNKAVDFMVYYKKNGWVKSNDDRLKGERCSTYHFCPPL